MSNFTINGWKVTVKEVDMGLYDYEITFKEETYTGEIVAFDEESAAKLALMKHGGMRPFTKG